MRSSAALETRAQHKWKTSEQSVNRRRRDVNRAQRSRTNGSPLASGGGGDERINSEARLSRSSRNARLSRSSRVRTHTQISLHDYRTSNERRHRIAISTRRCAGQVAASASAPRDRQDMICTVQKRSELSGGESVAALLKKGGVGQHASN